MRQTLYLDIETLPAPESVMAEIEVSPPGNMKKAETIEKWMAEEADACRREKWEKTALDGWQGSICVAAMAVGDGAIHHSIGDEAGIIRAIFSLFKPGAETVCGHNIAWDLEFIKRRAVLLGVRIPLSWPVNEKPWSDRIRCTMRLAAGDRDTIRLQTLCKHLGIEVEDGIDGSQVLNLWRADQFDGRQAVIRHCIADVERVREIDRRFRAAGI